MDAQGYAASPSLLKLLDTGKYVDILCSAVGKCLVTDFVESLLNAGSEDETGVDATAASQTDKGQQQLIVGLASFNAFLQTNVTGPVLAGSQMVETLFCDALRQGRPHDKSYRDHELALKRVRKACLARLKIDGVAPYPHVTSIELFCFAKYIFSTATITSPKAAVSLSEEEDATQNYVSLPWVRLRIDTWHYRLLTQPSLGPGATVLRSGWLEVPTLVRRMLAGVGGVRAAVVDAGADVEQEVWILAPEEVGAGGTKWTRDERVECLVEIANVYVMLGMDKEATKTLGEAVIASGLSYVLTGALGKRTKWQENEVSQLVVLAKSRDQDEGADSVKTSGEANGVGVESEARPNTLPLNDDTLLENVAYSSEQPSQSSQSSQSSPAPTTNASGATTAVIIPPALVNLSPASQPQLRPLDQAILLADATVRDAFAPVDVLTATEVAPFAARVLADGSANWQIYTQALLVRSRIETRRSRTVERGVLQMQAVVDQVVMDVGGTEINQYGGGGGDDVKDNAKMGEETEEAEKTEGREKLKVEQTDNEESQTKPTVPTITITNEAALLSVSSSPTSKPTSFLPTMKPTESAPAPIRLAHVHALASPPRWHLESELAYAWAQVGSLVSALEIFKRLRLWAEVALCLASRAAADDDDQYGRGSGGDERARGVLRWRLYRRANLGEPPDGVVVGNEDPDEDIDPSADPCQLSPSTFSGPLRDPPSDSAARLLCILGDLESDPAHYQKAWDLSRGRFARAQRSLGEHHIQKGDFEAARTAYRLATGTNRTSAELWSRLGEICLKLGAFKEAASAFRRAVGAAGEYGLSGEDAKTWSNLGSALWSLWKEMAARDEGQKKAVDVGNANEEASMRKKSDDIVAEGHQEVEEEDDDENPSTLLTRALGAFKRGAAIAHSNWRIWDNVVTIAAQTRPPAWMDMVQATRNIAKIRSTEQGLDVEVLRMMVNGCLGQDSTRENGERESDQGGKVSEEKNDEDRGKEGGKIDGIEEATHLMPPRGTIERAVIELLEDVVVPLITSRSELWEVVSRQRAWRGDFKGAVDAAERAWRTEMGHGAATSSGSLSVGAAGEQAWLVDEKAWAGMARRTEELVGALERWSPEPRQVDGNGKGIGTRWKTRAKMAIRSVMGKARERWEGSEEWTLLSELLERLG